MWEQSKYALDFFTLNDIPFWNMVNANSLAVVAATDNDNAAWCLKEKETNRQSFYVLYLPDGGTVDLDLTAVETSASYSVQWFDPLLGGDLQTGSVSTVNGGVVTSLGDAPYTSGGGDWAILLRCSSNECPTVGAVETTAPVDSPPVSSPVTTEAPVVAPTTSAPMEAPTTDSPVMAPTTTTTDSPVEAPDTIVGDVTTEPTMAPANAVTTTPVALSTAAPTVTGAEFTPTAAPTTTLKPSLGGTDERTTPNVDLPTTGSTTSSATKLLFRGRWVVSSLGLLAAFAGVAW